MELPPIVDAEEWQRSHEDLIAREKAMTRASDELAAERRRRPMTEFSTNFEFAGPDGTVDLLGLFEGRRQLIVYHFWFPPDGEPCTGCSMFADQVGELAHLNARDTSFALVSRAPQEQIQEFKRRMGWSLPWFTDDEDFQRACDTTEYFALDVFLRDGDRAFLAYRTRSRGVEALGSVWSFLDLTPFGRQEEWEETPADRPQTSPYGWWRLHDEYEAEAGPS